MLAVKLDALVHWEMDQGRDMLKTASSPPISRDYYGMQLEIAKL